MTLRGIWGLEVEWLEVLQEVVHLSLGIQVPVLLVLHADGTTCVLCEWVVNARESGCGQVV